MSSTGKIQLKKPLEGESGEKNDTPQKHPGGRPRKISDPVLQNKLLIELLGKMKGVSRKEGFYQLEREELNCQDNIDLLKLNVFEIKKVFPGCEYARRMGNMSPVYTLMRQLCKILNIKFERVSYSSTSRIEYRIYI